MVAAGLIAPKARRSTGHAIERADAVEHARAAGRDAVAAGLVAREARPVEQRDLQALAREQAGGGRAGRSGPDDADVERQGGRCGRR